MNETKEFRTLYTTAILILFIFSNHTFRAQFAIVTSNSLTLEHKRKQAQNTDHKPKRASRGNALQTHGKCTRTKVYAQKTRRKHTRTQTHYYESHFGFIQRL